RLVDFTDNLGEPLREALHGSLKLAGFVGAIDYNTHTEIAGGHTFGGCNRLGNGASDATGDGEGDAQTQGDCQNGQDNHQFERTGISLIGDLNAVCNLLGLYCQKFVQSLEEGALGASDIGEHLADGFFLPVCPDQLDEMIPFFDKCRPDG